MILLCCFPAAMALPTHWQAILWRGYAGEASGQATADTLFGTHNPDGRLTSTFYPKSYVTVRAWPLSILASRLHHRVALPWPQHTRNIDYASFFLRSVFRLGFQHFRCYLQTYSSLFSVFLDINHNLWIMDNPRSTAIDSGLKDSIASRHGSPAWTPTQAVRT